MTSDLGRTDVKIGKDYGGRSTIGPMYDRPLLLYPFQMTNLMDSVRAFKDSLDLKTIRHRELKLPLDKYNSVENLDIYSITEPSKGYLFANLDHIRTNVIIDHNLIDSTYAYLYCDKKNGLYCKVVLDEAPFENEYDECVRLRAAVTQLAKHYDKAIVERMFNMNYEEFMNLRHEIACIGGQITVESTGIGEMSTVSITVPNCKLGELMGLRSKTECKGTPTPKTNKSDLPVIKDIQFFNKRATIIEFTDGTRTKSECSKDDEFSEETGIAYCLFKKCLGENGHAKFNDLMREAHKILARKDENAKKDAEQRAEEIARKRRRAEAAKRRKARKRQEQVDIIADAITQFHTVKPDE